MKTFVSKQARRVAAPLVAVGAFVVSVAAKADGSAAVQAVTSAATSSTSDIQSVGGIIVGVVVAVAAVGWIRRVIK